MPARELKLVSFESVSNVVFEHKTFYHRGNVSSVGGNFAVFNF